MNQDDDLPGAAGPPERGLVDRVREVLSKAVRRLPDRGGRLPLVSVGQGDGRRVYRLDPVKGTENEH